MRDVDEGEVGPLGCRVAHVRDAALRTRVLQVDGGNVAAGAPPAEPALGQLELVRPLEHDDVDVGLGRLLRRDLDRRGRPVPGSRAAEPIGTAVGKRG
jgi:hypothetical protein